jgi:hypothetical protein
MHHSLHGVQAILHSVNINLLWKIPEAVPKIIRPLEQKEKCY